MQNLQERALTAANNFILKYGGEVVDVDYTNNFVVFLDDDALVFSKVTVITSDNLFPKVDVFGSCSNEDLRSEFEQYCFDYLSKSSADYADRSVRFDRIYLAVFNNNQALLRHHANCLCQVA